MGQIGKYETISQLGQGAMGTVYRARDAALEREVALKTIRTGPDVDPQVRERFIREARACARLQHPNIITVYELGEAGNLAYIAMELLLGSDFRQIIQEQRPIPLDLKIAAVAQVCDGIAHAHRHGVIHRDIKPSNLFWTGDGPSKVLDFGIARLPSSRLTVAGQILGTPNYMAPEQILARPSDGRADIFSVAVVLFELLTYAHPFNSPLIPKRIVQGEPDSLFDHDSSLPVVLEKVLARGLAKEPGQRYATCEEFAADLRTILDGLKGNASPTFSRIELPSERAVSPSPTETGEWMPADAVKIPEGQDPDEWRLSEALRLLPEFEAAIDRQDEAKAKATAAELEACLAGDIRFAEALRLCRSRLHELMDAIAKTKTIQPGRSPAKSESSARLAMDSQKSVGVLVEPSSSQTPAPRRIADIDATIFGSRTGISEQMGGTQKILNSVAAEASGSLRPADPPGPQTIPARPADAETVVFRPAVHPAPPPPLWANPKVVIAAGSIICGLLLLFVFIIATRPVPIEPFVATATVQPSSTQIHAAPDSEAKTIATVIPGTQLNVLVLPISRDRPWTMVQLLKPKVIRPGYIRTDALLDWHGIDGPTALTIGRILGTGEAGSEGEIEKQIHQLSDVTSRFSTEPAAQEARVDIVRLTLALAQRLKNGGRPPSDWELQLQSAQRTLEPLRGEQSLQSVVTEFDQQMGAIRGEEKAVPVAPPPSKSTLPPVTGGALPRPRPNVPLWLKEAEDLRQSGDYSGAKQMVEKVLQIEPHNSRALSLREKIDRGSGVETK